MSRFKVNAKHLSTQLDAILHTIMCEININILTKCEVEREEPVNNKFLPQSSFIAIN